MEHNNTFATDLDESNHRAGRLTRFVAPSTVQPEAMTAAPSATRVGNSVTRYTNGGDVEAVGGVTRHAVSFDGTPGGRIMDTLERQNGQPTVELIPGTPSSRTQLQVAIREGLVRETHPGVFEEVQGRSGGLVEALNAPKVEEQADDSGAKFFDAEDGAIWDRAIERLAQPIYDSAVASAQLAAIRGVDLSGTARSFAQAAGMEPAQAAEYVEAGAAMFRRVAERSVAAVGISEAQMEPLWAFCRESPGKLSEALGQLVHRRDPSGFQALAREFRRANPGDLSAYHKAGFESHVDRDGEVMLKRQGGNWVKARDLA